MVLDLRCRCRRARPGPGAAFRAIVQQPFQRVSAKARHGPCVAGPQRQRPGRRAHPRCPRHPAQPAFRLPQPEALSAQGLAGLCGIRPAYGPQAAGRCTGYGRAFGTHQGLCLASCPCRCRRDRRRKRTGPGRYCPPFPAGGSAAGLRSLYAALQEERATALSRAAAHYASDAYRELLHKLDDNAAAQTCRPMLDRRGRARPMLLADIMAAGVDQATRRPSCP